MRGARGPAALAAMALAAWPLGLLFRVSAPRPWPASGGSTTRPTLEEVGAPWIFTALALADSPPPAGGGQWSWLAPLALPSTVHFVVKKACSRPTRFRQGWCAR
jgi:hypothetical protein